MLDKVWEQYLLEGHPGRVQGLIAQLDLEVLGGRVRLADVDREPLLIMLSTPAQTLGQFQNQSLQNSKSAFPGIPLPPLLAPSQLDHGTPIHVHVPACQHQQTDIRRDF